MNRATCWRNQSRLSSNIVDVGPETQERALPRGPHQLSRAAVEKSQRERLLWAVTEAVAAKGYNATTVADIISGAKVSRTTFYQLFDDKLACFLAANRAASELLVTMLESELERIDREPDLSPQLKFEELLTSYLDAITSLAGVSRVFLVEVYAAGSPAVAQRRELMGKFIDLVVASRWGVAEGLISEAELRALADVVVSAVSLHATTALASDDLDSLAEIRNSLSTTMGLLLGEARPPQS